MQQGYLKITMKRHLKQNDHSFYHHIPIFNYGEFSYYAYIHNFYYSNNYYVPW